MILKLCGFKTEEDIQKVNLLNIDMVGFIHYPKSKRHVDISHINKMSLLMSNDIDKVVVVVNPTFQKVKDLIENTAINTIQFHGKESPEFIKNIRDNFKNIKIIKALSADHKVAETMKLYKDFVDLFIIDTPSTQYGGTGESFDWSLLNHIDIEVPYLIAGGIDANKITQIEKMGLKHAGYDISSGIEIAGNKDKNKMITIVKLVKGVLKNEKYTNRS
ncbi:phosphoribosylanthranilate isomerase [Staphylococcus devriesei]|nr:phosphoribosylanthranilate isomerase [Staphylococcus devriesei]